MSKIRQNNWCETFIAGPSDNDRATSEPRVRLEISARFSSYAEKERGHNVMAPEPALSCHYLYKTVCSPWHTPRRGPDRPRNTRNIKIGLRISTLASWSHADLFETENDSTGRLARVSRARYCQLTSCNC